MSQTFAQPPKHRYDLLRLVKPTLRVLLGKPSSLYQVSSILVNGMSPPPRVLHPENIPSSGSFVLVVNHYDHKGLGAWWGISLLAHAIHERRPGDSRELHFAMAREWWYPSGLGRAVKQPLTRWFFGQLGKSYGLVLLPPALGNNEFRGQGVVAVRHAMALTRGDKPELIGIAPEGRTGPDLTLCEPPLGAGLFLLMLTNERMPCLPVGLFEENSILSANFGEPFCFRKFHKLPRDVRDREAARQAMLEIGTLLPERMWGVYQEDIHTAKRPG